MNNFDTEQLTTAFRALTEGDPHVEMRNRVLRVRRALLKTPPPITDGAYLLDPLDMSPHWYRLTAATIIGRSRDATITINALWVSLEHCRIAQVGDTWTIEDCQSTNGTRVNGRRVTRQRLHTGDEIDIEHARLIFVQIPLWTDTTR